MGIFKDIKNLVKGLGITSKHLGRHAITLQYPEEKMEMPERSRGIVVLLSDKETGDLNCTACELCARACPTSAINIEQHRDESKKKHLDSFVVDNTLCCFCGLCVEACNFCAIEMATGYEFSTINKDDLTWDVNKLQEMGRDVPYVDTRKKKKPKPKPKPKPAAEEEAAPKAEDKPAQAKSEAKPEGAPPTDTKPVEGKPANDTEVKEEVKAEQPKADEPKPDNPEKTDEPKDGATPGGAE